MLKIYLARSMSGRIKEEVVYEARLDRDVLEFFDIQPLCPVAEEKVRAEFAKLQSTPEQMMTFWPRDKKMIEESNVLFDMSPQMKSEGVAHEIGYARYFLYKPVIRVYKGGNVPPKSSVAFFEDDYIADSLLDAILYVKKTHGTLLKRLLWRLNLYRRCLPKMIRVWFQAWK